MRTGRVAILAVSFLLLFQRANAQVDITLIDVGQGDSILVTFPALADGTRKRMLIDGGVSTSSNAPVVRFLQSQGIQELDWVVLSHPHIDHYGGLIPVLNQFTIKELWTTGEAATCANPNTCEWMNFVSARANAQSDIAPSQGLTRTSQGAKVQVLMAGGRHPDNGAGDDINNDSLSLMLTYKRVKVLFTGDIEGDGGLELVNEYCSPTRATCSKLNADIIKIPHHGSAHLSSRFAQLAAAEIVLISAGFENRQFHHPRTAALRTYADFGANEFFSTSATGDDAVTVTIAANGDIVRPTLPASQTYTAWRELDNESACTAANTHGGFCLVNVQQGQPPQ
jgi:competence protein ComEC